MTLIKTLRLACGKPPPLQRETGKKSLQKATSPCKGEAREEKAYGPFTGRKERLRNGWAVSGAVCARPII